MTKDKLPFADCDEFTLQASACQTTEEELISLLNRAREGSTEAYFVLRQRYRPLIDASVSRFTAQSMSLQEREDLREEAERVFLSAVSTYNTEQESVDFGLYAKICLRNGLVSEMRSLKARHRLGIVPLEADEISEAEDPASDLVEAERFHRLYQMIHRSLSPFENDVWWRFVSGISVKTIAGQVGKDERSVHNAIYRIRKKLRSLLSDDGKGL
ncbi:MAG: sigma-70 family RNA polymerase sigma factor [Clostridia bacterium]|nr:sigma-70 family RNA polymerase sigma factor [Clostridia bacterium]